MLKPIKKIILTWLIMSIGLPLQGQDRKYLEFQRVLFLQNDTLKCRQLIKYAENVRDSLHDYNLALKIYEKADSILLKQNYPNLNVLVDYNKGFTYFLKGNYREADKYYSKALSYNILNKQEEFKAKILHNAGVNLTRIKAFKRALAYYDQSLAIYTRTKNNTGIGSVYFNMSLLFGLYGKDEKMSKQLLDKAIKILGKNTIIEGYSYDLQNRAAEHASAGNYDSAKILMNRALKVPLTIPLKIPATGPGFTSAESYGQMYSSLGKCYARLEIWDSSFYFLDKSKHFSDSLGLPYSANGEYYNDLGYCYDLKEDFEKALYYYKLALKDKINSSNCRFLLENIADIFLYQKQYDSAFSYKEKAIKYSDSLYATELKEYVDFENNRVDLLEEDYKMQVKSAQQEKLVAQLSKRNYVFISVIVFLVASVLIFFVYFRQYKLKIKKEHLQSELDFLRAQLNPHFLFNSLNNIYVLLDKNKDEALGTLLKFSELMRYQLYECNVSSIQLSKELHFLENYIKFEDLRYSDKINVQCNIAHSDTEELMIAPLLLQPFIENAFKHTPKKRNQQSEININISIAGNDLVFQVVNTLNTKKASVLPGGIGLKNVKKRLKLLYSGKHDLKIYKTDQHFNIVLKLTLTHD